MRCVISVLGKDRSGIVAAISAVLAEKGANIDDISQTILDVNFQHDHAGSFEHRSCRFQYSTGSSCGGW